jgi:hypothetical protein
LDLSRKAAAATPTTHQLIHLSQMKTRSKSSSTKASAEEFRNTYSEFESSGGEEDSVSGVESEEEEKEEEESEQSLLSEAGRTQFLKDIESVGGPWNCTKGNRKFATICDRNQALYGKKGSKKRRGAQNLVTAYKTKSTVAKYVELLHKRNITVSDTTLAKLQQELAPTGTTAVLPSPAAITSPPSVPNTQQRKVASTAGKQQSGRHSSQKKLSTQKKQTPTFSSPRELFPDSTMQNSKQANTIDPNKPRIPLRYQNHESCMYLLQSVQLIDTINTRASSRTCNMSLPANFTIFCPLFSHTSGKFGESRRPFGTRLCR